MRLDVVSAAKSVAHYLGVPSLITLGVGVLLGWLFSFVFYRRSLRDTEKANKEMKDFILHSGQRKLFSRR